MTEALEKRLEALEAENAIRKLKYTYLNACDRKDVRLLKPASPKMLNWIIRL